MGQAHPGNITMNYSALNAKIKAMSARLLTAHDYNQLSQLTPDEILARLDVKPSDMGQALKTAADNICRFIPDKTQREYVQAAATNLQTGSIRYYTAQWKRLSKMNTPNQAALRPALGAEIDLTNILWMYRLKRYHRIKGDETYGYLIPIRHRLSRETTQQLAQCPTAKSLLQALTHSNYAQSITTRHPEQSLTNAITKRHKLSALRHPNTLAPTMAYIYMKRLEIQKITNMVNRGALPHTPQAFEKA